MTIARVLARSTPLHLAAGQGQPEMTLCLLEAGADKAGFKLFFALRAEAG